MKVLICDATDPKALETITEAGIEVINRPDITPEELEDAIPEYNCMVVRSRTKVGLFSGSKSAILMGVRFLAIIEASDCSATGRGGYELQCRRGCRPSAKAGSIVFTASPWVYVG